MKLMETFAGSGDAIKFRQRILTRTQTSGAGRLLATPSGADQLLP